MFAITGSQMRSDTGTEFLAVSAHDLVMPFDTLDPCQILLFLFILVIFVLLWIFSLNLHRLDECGYSAAQSRSL